MTLNCPGAVGVTVTPGLPATSQTQLIVSPTAALPAGSNCTLTVVAANISDTDQDEPPDLMLNNFTLTFSVDSAPTEVQTETEVAGVFQDGVAQARTMSTSTATSGCRSTSRSA